MLAANSTKKLSILKSNELKSLNIFWIGFLLYTVSYTFSTTTYLNYVVCQLFQILGLLLLIPAFINLIEVKFENKYLQFVFSIYCVWLLGVVLRGFLINYDFIKVMLFDAWFGMFIYVVPLILLLPKNLFYYKKIFDVIIALGIFYILYDIIFIKELLNPDGTDTKSQAIVEYSKTLGLPSFFLILTYKYHSNKRMLLVALIVVLTVFCALIRARRGLLLMSIIPLFFTYILYISSNKHKFLSLFLSLIIGLFIIIFGVEFFNANKKGIFGLITERGLEDTRSTVELCFFYDMSTLDWIMGRGINGQYYCPGIDADDITGYRSVIETDFLQIILKGGVISLGLLLLIAIPAIFKGIFYSKNLLSKAAGVWVFYTIISMYPATVNTFTMQYILAWVSIGICYSKVIRNMPENQLVLYFRS